MRQASDWLDLADGLVFGRRTYDAFARDWPQITDPDDPFTVRMNTLPKCVLSNSLTEGSWNPTTVLRGDPAETVAALKEQPGRELLIHGRARLAASLLAAGVVNTLRLAMAPVVIGEGRQLLPLKGASVGLRLVDHHSTPGGLLLLEYETAGPAPFAEYSGSPALT